jgi:hypothetical protein
VYLDDHLLKDPLLGDSIGFGQLLCGHLMRHIEELFKNKY